MNAPEHIERDVARRMRGCSPQIIAVVAVIVAILGGVIAVVALGGDDDDSDESEQTTDDTGATDSTATTAPIPEGGFNVPAQVPEGDEIVEGSSGDQVGCIACDGQFRYLNVTATGVHVGDGTPAQTPWDANGTVVEFGARINGANPGRYGVNLFVAGSESEYRHGCALEIGQTSCKANNETRLEAGELVNIQIGEAGTLTPEGTIASNGDFTIDWWFVFRPDPPS